MGFLISAIDTLRRPSGEDQCAPNTFAIHGESGTGFEKAGNLGEFECGNCRYFDTAAGACDQADMKLMSKQPRLADGRVVVANEDCCTYVSRVGEQDADDDHD